MLDLFSTPPRSGKPRDIGVSHIMDKGLGLRQVEDLLDAGIVFGTGFAPFRGGPLHYARSRGVESVVVRLRELAAAYGPRFAPDAGWELLRGKA